MSDLRDYVSLTEAAALLNLHRDTLKRRIRDGSLRAVRVSPRKIYVLRTDLDAQIQPV